MVRAYRGVIIACGTAALLLSGCGGPEVNRSTVELPPARDRTIIDVEPEIVWERGGAAEDTVLLQPVMVAADSMQVAIADWGDNRVRVFSRATGENLWAVGGRGEGPGEYGHLSSLMHGSDEGWTVWDQTLGRLTHLRANGRLGPVVNLGGKEAPIDLCPLGEGRYAATLSSAGDAVGIVSESGEWDDLAPLPWEGFEETYTIQRQSRWAALGGSCVLSLKQSTGFAEYGPGGFRMSAYYVEPPQIPEATRRVQGASRSTRLEGYTFAAEDAAVRGSEFWVLAAGATSDSGRLIDIYDLSSGDYLRTYRLPFAGSALASSGDLLFLIGEDGGYPVLKAFRAPVE